MCWASRADRREVGKVRTRLLAKVDQQRTGSTKVTLGYTIDAWLQVHEADERTLEGYRGYAERTIKLAWATSPSRRSALGCWSSFTRSCGAAGPRCNGRGFVEHFTDEAHECDQVVRADDFGTKVHRQAARDHSARRREGAPPS
ncbi:hypothetical protein GCM10023317_53910 [Actinopolymorpha pittospori]